MRALTLSQPWAGLVASGIKLVENRPRSMIKREDFAKPFAIHASREIDEGVYARIFELAPGLRNCGDYFETPWYRLTRITSAVIGVATIDGVVSVGPASLGFEDDNSRAIRALGDQRRWFFGPIGYVLRDVVALAEPVPCRGWQGFWTLDADTERRVREQLR